MTHFKKPAGAIVLCLLLWTAGASLLLAQIKSGSIVGLVTDKTGGVIAGAEVSAVNEETNVAANVRSDSDGQYAVPYLAPGRYTVTIKKEGFSNFTQSGVALTASQQARVDAQLQVGEVTARVEVTAPVAMLETESSSVQDSMGNRMIDALPNISDNPLYLTTYISGVVGKNDLLSSQDAMSFGIGYTARAKASAFGINGSEALMNDINVDGVNVMGVEYNDAVALPNSDAIQEIRVITNDYSAEYGRGQGQVSIISKSGTNSFHGSIFDRLRNDALNANTFSNNTLGIARLPFKVDYFGGTFGGPIKKDKLFFFASYEGMSHHTAAQWLATVPTDLEKKGNFSQTLVNVNGVPTPMEIFNPFSVTEVSSNLYQRAQVPNAMIQTPNPVALALLSNYPDPNHTPTDVYNSNNYFSSGLQTYRKDDVNARIDYHLGRNSIYGSGGLHHGSILTPGPWGPSNPYWVRQTYPASGPPPLVTDKNPFAAIGDTISLNPTTLVDLRFGIQRVNSQWATPLYPNFNYNALDIPADLQAIFPLPGSVPNVITSRWTDLSLTSADHKHTFMTDYDPAGSVTKVVGKWTLREGFEYRADFFADPNIYEGSVSFNETVSTSEFVDPFGNNTAQDTTPQISGFPDAAFLLGAGSLGITAGQSVRNASLDKYFALYTQNDWHATHRLTINLGLRWDLQPAVTERYNRLTAFDTTKMNVWGTQGVLAFAGVGGYSRNLWDTHYRDFGPRIGAAYRISDTLVVRGGYGLTYVPANTGMLPGPFNFGMAPFSVYTNQIPYGTSPDGVPIGTFTDPNVSLPVIGPGASSAAPQNYGTGLNLFQRHNYLDGRVQQWNVIFEKRLPGAWIASIGYTGTHGDHLPVTRFPAVSEGLLSQALDNCYRNGVGCPANDSAVASNDYVQTGKDPGAAAVPNPWNPNGTLPFGGSLASKTLPRYVVDSQYPMFVGNTSSYSFGWSNYDAMNIEVRHQFAQGLQLDSNFTWSKTLDFTGWEAPMSGAAAGPGFYTGANDLRNLKNNYRVSFDDLPYRLVVSLFYQLPFGDGQHFSLQQNRALRAFAGGWRLGADQVFQGGYPIPITGGNNALNSRPTVTGEPWQVPKALQHWYNGTTTVTLPDGRQVTPCADCFLKYNADAFDSSTIPNPTSPGKYLADAYYMGDAADAYDSIRSPRYNNLDLSLTRTFKVNERVSVDFSANASNALNHTELCAGGCYSGSSVSGYPGSLGSINLVPSAAGQVGQPTNSSGYGVINLSTYDPRQIEFQLKIRF